MEIGDCLKFREIEDAFRRFKSCPKCKSAEGFWLGMKRDKPYAHCKGCGATYELYEVYVIGEKSKAPKELRFFRK
jgi:hypothetical protein